MVKTTNDIVTHALRKIGVLAIDEVASGTDFGHARDTYHAEFARVKADQGFAWTFTYDTVPDDLLVPMSEFLASTLTDYGRPVPNHARAIAQLRAYSFPDDRPDPADYDEDGTVTAAEQDASDRAAYY